MRDYTKALKIYCTYGNTHIIELIVLYLVIKYQQYQNKSHLILIVTCDYKNLLKFM